MTAGKRPLTPQKSTLLQMIHSFSRITLAQFLPDEPGHHAAHPLFPDNRVAGIMHGNVVFEFDAVVRRGHRGFFGLEGGGFGSRHFGGCWSFAREEEKGGFGLKVKLWLWWWI